MTRQCNYQNGATLLVGLIMLLLMTVLSLLVFQLGKGNLIIVNNAQHRTQGLSAAQAAIEAVVSSPTFLTKPLAAISQPCQGVPNRRCADIDANGTDDLVVAVTPTCVATHVIPVPLLDYTDAGDVSCSLGASQETGMIGASANRSLCAKMLWDVQAVATDEVMQSELVVNQGTSVRVEAFTTCP